MSDEDPRKCLTAITLDDRTIGRGAPDIEHERNVAIFDLLESNSFSVLSHDGGPYQLKLSISEGRLVLEISEEGSVETLTHILSLAPLRKIVKDYFMICESYYAAIKTATPMQIETIDMARRSVHNEGSDTLVERLAGKIAIDFNTARRLFTLICVLHWKG
jgi:uncharacterized protein (UPF0262 family)